MTDENPEPNENPALNESTNSKKKPTSGITDNPAPEDQPDSPTDVREDLEMYFEDHLPVEIWLNETDSYDGMIISIGRDYVLTARIWQFSWLHGFRAIS